MQNTKSLHKITGVQISLDILCFVFQAMDKLGHTVSVVDTTQLRLV